MEIDPTKVAIFRGGSAMDVTATHIKIGSDGLLRTTHGLSLDISAEAMSRFGGAFRIQSIPADLKVIQRGNKLGHFEVVPRIPMSLDRYKELVAQIILAPAG
jgi:hypothetical protein